MRLQCTSIKIKNRDKGKQRFTQDMRFVIFELSSPNPRRHSLLCTQRQLKIVLKNRMQNVYAWHTMRHRQDPIEDIVDDVATQHCRRCSVIALKLPKTVNVSANYGISVPTAYRVISYRPSSCGPPARATMYHISIKFNHLLQVKVNGKWFAMRRKAIAFALYDQLPLRFGSFVQQILLTVCACFPLLLSLFLIAMIFRFFFFRLRLTSAILIID